MTMSKIAASGSASEPTDTRISVNTGAPRLFLTEVEVAERQGRSVKTLQNQRVNGDGIPFLKLGRTVRYRLADVEAWENACARKSTSDKGKLR